MKLLLCALVAALSAGCITSLHPHKLPPPQKVPTYSTNVALKYVPRPPAPPPIPGTSTEAFRFNYNLSPVQTEIRLRIVDRGANVGIYFPTNKPYFHFELSTDLTNWSEINYTTRCKFDSNGIWGCEFEVARPKNLATEFYRLRR